MHYKTPEDKEVFLGAVFAFLLVHNETYGDNNLPDVGNEDAWYVVPIGNNIPWPDVEPGVEAIEAEKLGENHYRFGMRYTDLPARIVSAQGGFLLSLAFPILTVLFSELVIEYDIRIDPVTGQVHAETLYTIGQVTRARWFGFIDQDPHELIVDSMVISAVHYLSIFESNYNVTKTGTGNVVQPPSSTTPLAENLTIRIGDDDERAFDIGLGRSYNLINETNGETILQDVDALNSLLAATASDFLLIAWQAPLSAFLFAHMAYGLSAQIRNQYASVQSLVTNAPTAFHNSQWWYAVSFPEWNGYRVEQDPVYVAYTNLSQDTMPIDGEGGGGLLLLGIAVVAIIAVILVIRRR